MCKEGAYPLFLRLDLELALLLARIADEPLTLRLRDLSRQLQDALDASLDEPGAR